jgi:hypothetical protein
MSNDMWGALMPQAIRFANRSLLTGERERKKKKKPNSVLTAQLNIVPKKKIFQNHTSKNISYFNSEAHFTMQQANRSSNISAFRSSSQDSADSSPRVNARRAALHECHRPGFWTAPTNYAEYPRNLAPFVSQ